MILRSAGFVTNALIRGQNAVNFAYIIYLRGRVEKIPASDLERLVRRWYAMAILRGRYTGSPETAFDEDIRQITSRGLETYANSIIESELPESFWTGMLPSTYGYVSVQQPVLPSVSSCSGETRRQGISISGHHRDRFVDVQE